jgi:hypothetical protein
MRVLGLLVAFTSVGCIDSFGSNSREVEGEEDQEDGDIDRDDCKIEGDAIGQEGVILRLGAKTVTFSDWVAKSDSPGEYIGFSLSLEGADTISYVVKTGGELHPSTSLVWAHPNGDAGDQTPGISNVDHCEECEDGSCGEPPCENPDGCDGGDEPTCENPDGCPDPGEGSGPIL